MQDSPSDSGTSTLEYLLRTVPACKRCREKHRRCDVALPKCRNCSNAGLSECMYYDPILGQLISRSHVMSLASQLRQLLASDQSSSNEIARTSVPIKQFGLFSGSDSIIPASLLVATDLPPILDNINPLTTGLEVYQPHQISRSLHDFLLHHFISHVQPLYPILDLLDFPSAFDQQAQDPNASPQQRFVLNMVYIISGSSLPRHPQASALVPILQTFRRRAMEVVEVVTKETSIQTLRNVSLLALYSLSAPDQGNLTQLITLAVRLAIDLGISKSNEPLLRPLYQAVFCLERRVALCLDRPWLLPAPTVSEDCDKDKIITLLCDLTQIQCSQRSHHASPGFEHDQNDNCEQDFTRLQKLATTIESLTPFSPSLLGALREAELYVTAHQRENDTTESRARALALVNAHSNPNCIRTCLSPHWTFKALHMLVNNSSSITVARASREFHAGLLILDRDTAIWPGCVYLLDAIQKL